jgi:hypothetical protein
LANVTHSTMTGAELHEPKGVVTATTGTVATASGGSVVWQSPGGAIYGEMKITGNTTPLVFTSGGVLDTDTDYIQIDSGMWATGETQGVTFNALGYLEITIDGLYEVSTWACFSLASSGTQFVAFKYSTNNLNTALSPRRLTRQSNNSGDIGSVSASGFANLVIGDKISLWGVTNATASSVTIIDAGLTVTLLKAV